MHGPQVALATLTLSDGQGLRELGELALAFVLSTLIGIEREWRQKSAGLRTHTLVGVGAALFMIVSKYGFADVLGADVRLDPSRVAAQIVSGIGFIGGGLIFVRGSAVKGLTTAAIVWVTAAIGATCGAGLALLALFAAGLHFIVVLGYPWVAGRLPRSGAVGFGVRVVYEDGRGILRDVLDRSTRAGFTIDRLTTQQLQQPVGGRSAVAVSMELRGQPSARGLTTELESIDGVHEVTSVDLAESGD